MNCREVRYYLDDFAKGRLIDEMREEIESHISACEKCQGEFIDLNLILSEVKSSPKIIDPSKDLWDRINQKILDKSGKRKGFTKIFSLLSNSNQIKYEDDEIKAVNLEKKKARLVFIGGTTATILLGVLLGIIFFQQTSDGFITVENISGLPKIDSEEISKQGILQIGKWLETNESSSAKLFIGKIGEVEVYPSSKIKLIKTTPTEHRLSLDYGKIEATIWAAPRLFFIETPSGTAIDLGCLYTLEVDKEGKGLLTVKSGWVAFESDGRESFVPAGAVCKTKKNSKPGTPYFTDTDERFIDALEDLDFSTKAFGSSYSKNVENYALQTILELARKKDALSLWHILAKVDGEERAKTYFRLAELVEIPDMVTFEGIMNGDQPMLDDWWESLGFGSKTLWKNL